MELWQLAAFLSAARRSSFGRGTCEVKPETAAGGTRVTTDHVRWWFSSSHCSTAGFSCSVLRSLPGASPPTANRGASGGGEARRGASSRRMGKLPRQWVVSGLVGAHAWGLSASAGSGSACSACPRARGVTSQSPQHPADPVPPRVVALATTQR